MGDRPREFPQGSEIHDRETLFAGDAIPPPDGTRLLVVEEDPELRELLRDVLETAGYRVVAVADAPVAVAIAATFDGVVTRAPAVEEALCAVAPELPRVTFHPAPLHGLMLLAAVRRLVRHP